MKSWIIVLIVLLTLSIGGFITKNLLSNNYSKKLMKYLHENNPGFPKLLDSFVSKSLLDPYYRENLRLNYFVANKNDLEIEKCIHSVEFSNFTKKQKLVIYQTAFSYFVSFLNENKANKVLKIIEKFIEANKLNTMIVNDCKLDIDIYFERKLSVLDEVDKRIENSMGREKVGWIIKKVYVLKENEKVKEAKMCLEHEIDKMHDTMYRTILIKLFENEFE